MVIKASAAAEIRTLVAHLQSPDAVVRDGAAARLAVIGPRAVDRLLALYTTAPALATRLAILQALEGIGDPRALPPGRQALAEGSDVGTAAAGVLRRFLSSSDDRAAAGALDALVAAALDRSLDHRTRLAAFEAIQDCPPAVRDPVAEALRNGEDRILRAAADSDRAGPSSEGDAAWADALDGRLPARAATLHALVSARAPSTPLTSLRRLVESVRAREAAGGDAASWLALRGSLHQALAIRGSRVALYDLREAVEGATAPLPPSFLAALQSLGDASCLEGVAAAWTRASDMEWRQHLGVAFNAIARRERVTGRHAVARRIAARWPDAAALTLTDAGVSTPSRTRPRQGKADRSARRSR